MSWHHNVYISGCSTNLNIEMYPTGTRRNDNVIISKRHRGIVWRHNDVIFALCVRWSTTCLYVFVHNYCSVLSHLFAWQMTDTFTLIWWIPVTCLPACVGNGQNMSLMSVDNFMDTVWSRSTQHEQCSVKWTTEIQQLVYIELLEKINSNFWPYDANMRTWNSSLLLGTVPGC